MGLNEIYITIRGNILLMKPLPSVREDYSLLIQEEKQRKVYSTSHLLPEAITTHIGSTNNIGKQIHKNNRNDGRRSTLFYDYYKNSEHVKEKCFNLHLHEFPYNSKGYRDRNVVA